MARILSSKTGSLSQNGYEGGGGSEAAPCIMSCKTGSLSQNGCGEDGVDDPRSVLLFSLILEAARSFLAFIQKTAPRCSRDFVHPSVRRPWLRCVAPKLVEGLGQRLRPSGAGMGAKVDAA